jgi:hypothetical protein
MSRGPETTPEAPGSPILRRSLAWWVALALLAGCESASPRGAGPDPLLGDAMPSPAGGAAPAAPAASAAPATGTASGVPPLPATTTVTAPAALAGGAGTPPAPDSGRNDMRIPATPVSNPTPGAAGPPTPGWPQNGSPPPCLAPQAPEVAGSTARLSPVPAAPVPPVPFTLAASSPATGSGAAGQPDGYLQLQEMLRARGVTWQRLETWGDAGEWKFRCSIPNPQNRSVGRNYEARAAGDYGLAAIRAVIEQIDLEKGVHAPFH